MKFDMYVKNINNIKFNNQIFKIHKKKKRYTRNFLSILDPTINQGLKKKFVGFEHLVLSWIHIDD